MKYLVRNGKVEFSGSKKEIIDYILSAYEDDYFVQSYDKQLYHDNSVLEEVLDGLCLQIWDKAPKFRS